ncbi:hypothetical protein KIN20_021873 [Parelaphostrongylus tenuis]|uniref:Uncharacterized protein n=1 Tax=Parelaphostrongylus tenuis TaxID=148309 RepID=A0AAD5QUG0_PARTN|nr:hypothetical protein KIN20_021873 [Parelaphostrongylus tenuis]
MEIPETVTSLAEEKNLDDMGKVYIPTSTTPAEGKIAEYPSVAKTVTTVTTTRYMETPDALERDSHIKTKSEAEYLPSPLSYEEPSESSMKDEESLTGRQLSTPVSTAAFSGISESPSATKVHVEEYAKISEVLMHPPVEQVDQSLQKKYVITEKKYPTTDAAITTVTTVRHIFDDSGETERETQDEKSGIIDSEMKYVMHDEMLSDELQPYDEEDYSIAAKTITTVTSTQYTEVPQIEDKAELRQVGFE